MTFTWANPGFRRVVFTRKFFKICAYFLIIFSKSDLFPYFSICLYEISVISSVNIYQFNNIQSIPLYTSNIIHSHAW